MLLGKYVFRFHAAILFGVGSGVRTTTASLGLVQDAAKSQIPALGYGMTYAVGNTLLTIWGMVIMLLSEPELNTTYQAAHGCHGRYVMDVLKLRRIRQPGPVRDQGFLAKAAIAHGGGIGGGVPERRSRQPELGRH